MIRFEWDKNKNLKNIKKHHVSFEEAVSAFFDESSLIIEDEQHSELEERFVLMGLSTKGNLLVVCHCYRNVDETIRIISARKADTLEAAQYGGK